MTPADATVETNTPAAERVLERTIFATRWLLVPFYLGLVVGLLLLLLVFGQKAVDLIDLVWTAKPTDVALGVLALVDLCLMANLIVMIIFAGYECFVSRLDVGHERLAWMGRIGFGDLKLRLVASIVAISAIHLLEDFMKVGSMPDRELAWRLGLHGAFVLSGVLLACMDRLVGERH
ncbi:MAG: TIGR00645 family protein [Acetobacteraceae bacterium]|nr:TIGR00645 family protein [Pseudomonadota bacterium]